ncbi:MAG: nuclear transport factor 2 family protein [Saprospiraceae bacterium]|nr:nuclear transport factor 2 family protein [Saprospiraceae bacterium]
MKSNQKQIDHWKQEIIETEEAFAKLAAAEGISVAFTTFAAAEAVLMRNNDLVIGKEKIRQLYENQHSKGLAWVAEFVDVAASGDLGYTYGHYTYTSVDSMGNASQDRGVFHTVWKKQTDGSWKFVWD